MKIQQIRNATMKINYGGITFLLDPWLQDKGTGFSARAVRKEMVGVKNPINDLPMTPDEILSDVDYCLVTHIHPDHFTGDYLPDNFHPFPPGCSCSRSCNSRGTWNYSWLFRLAWHKGKQYNDSCNRSPFHGTCGRLRRSLHKQF